MSDIKYVAFDVHKATISTAVEALKDEAVKKIYERLTSKGIRAEMALLTIARKIAALSLAMWKSGEDYDEGKLTKEAA